MTTAINHEEPKCKCGEPHDGWPSNDGGQLCQMCWEAECDKSWWEMVRILDAASRIQEEGEGK